MKVLIGNRYRIVHNNESRRNYDGYILLLLLVAQMSLNYLGRTASETFYFVEIIPVLVLGHMFHKGIKKGTVDILLLAFLVALIALLISGLIAIR